ncbi:class I adenylate-forming enzyme family protein [uncultured Roseobacter sp.]|uniref:class I adenylate-forming enzyme family protein n=1 Tax=uncultured Roseobacter sp. TaxID=114847 RepID=UPI00261FA719|nr:class I adenylate-forming enzyme family protein [uncultured Roseobacter sp.]
MQHAPNLLSSFLFETAWQRGDQPALRDGLRELTYARTLCLASAIARDLQRAGLERGDRVVLLMSNSVGFCVTFWGVILAGGVVVPLNPDTKEEKLSWIIGNCEPKSIVADECLLAKVHAAVGTKDTAPYVLTYVGSGLLGQDLIAFDEETVDDSSEALGNALVDVIDCDLAAIIYTSGSTGDPKGVMLSHLNVTAAARSVSTYLGYRADDTVFCSIPLSFDYGLHQLIMSTLVGATLHVETDFAKPLFALSHLVSSAATVFPIVPTMVPLIEPLADRFDLRHIRCLTSTSAALHSGSIDRLAALFPDAVIFSMYGLTECHRCTYLDPAELNARKTSVGKAIPNTELWLVNDQGKRHFRNATGELVIRGSTVMKGYWKNTAKTAEKLRICPVTQDVVLFTGDTCRLDEDGFLYFIARNDDILKVGGQKVAPSEIERTLMAHSAVSQAAVISERHPAHGERPIAFVTVRPGVSIVSSALADWCRDRLEKHVMPARIVLVDAFERNANGKIDKHALHGLLVEYA